MMSESLGFLFAALALYFLAYLPARILFHDKDGSPCIADAWVYLLAGWAILAVLSMVFARFGWMPELSATIPGLVVILGFVRSETKVFRFESYARPSIGVIVVGLTAISMPLVATVMMGMGAYPRMFFGVETPQYLSYAHALSEFNQYPPPNLGLFDPTYGAYYHYGTSAMASILSRLSGLPVHKSMFLFLMPVILISTLCAASRIVQKVAGVPGWIGLLIIFFPLIIEPELVIAIFTDPRWALSRFANPQTFNHGFNMISSQFGFATALILFSSMLRLNEYGKGALLVAVIGILFFFKSQPFIALGLGMAGWCITRLLYKKEFLPFGLSVLALAIALGLLSILSFPVAQLKIGPGHYLSGTAFLLAEYIPLIVLPLLLIFWNRKNLLQSRAVEWLWFIIGPLLFLNIFMLERVHLPGGVPQLSSDLIQICAIAPYAIAVITLCLLGENWGNWANNKKTITAVIVVLLSAAPFAHAGHNLWRILSNPAMSHEHADNRLIAPALYSITPIKGSLSVTNDFDYRMTYLDTRKNKQFQLPAIFGHAWYGAVYTALENTSLNSGHRYESQQPLRQEKWDPSIVDDARKYGWTHLLINKKSSHPSNIPADPIYENDKYVVYLFSDMTSDN